MKSIEEQISEIEENIRSVHPDNPLAFEMMKKYRELQSKIITV